MPRHRIEIKLPAKAILNTDVSFEGWGDGSKLGELRISKGSIDWSPARRRSAIKLSWERFAALVEAQAR